MASHGSQPHPTRIAFLPSYNNFVLFPSRKVINFSASWFSSRSFWWLENIRSIHRLSGSPPTSVHPILLTFIQRLPTVRKVVSIIAACPLSCMTFHGNCCIIHLFLSPTHRSFILETCLKIWKFSLHRDNYVEVLWRFPRSLDTTGANRRSTLPLIERIA